MKLSRKQLFWVGTIAIVLFYFVNRGRILYSSTITTGTVATVKLAKATENAAATANPAILFSDKNNQRYLFWGYENETMLAIGDSVKVIYEDDQPSEATKQISKMEEKAEEALPPVTSKDAKNKTHKNNYNKQNMKKTNRVKNRVSFNVDKESKKKRTTRRNRNEKNAKNRTINASLRIKNRTLTPMPMPTSAT